MTPDIINVEAAGVKEKSARVCVFSTWGVGGGGSRGDNRAWCVGETEPTWV